MGLLVLYPVAFSRFLTVLKEMALPGNHRCLNDVLESHERRLTSLNNALSSRIVVLRGLPGLGRSLTSLVALCLFKSLEMMEGLRPT